MAMFQARYFANEHSPLCRGCGTMAETDEVLTSGRRNRRNSKRQGVVEAIKADPLERVRPNLLSVAEPAQQEIRNQATSRDENGVAALQETHEKTYSILSGCAFSHERMLLRDWSKIRM
jgi:hypothetical protein